MLAGDSRRTIAQKTQSGGSGNGGRYRVRFARRPFDAFDALAGAGDSSDAGVCARMRDISVASKARIVVLVTLPAPTMFSIAPIIASSDGASTTAIMS